MKVLTKSEFMKKVKHDYYKKRQISKNKEIDELKFERCMSCYSKKNKRFYA